MLEREKLLTETDFSEKVELINHRVGAGRQRRQILQRRQRSLAIAVWWIAWKRRGLILRGL